MSGGPGLSSKELPARWWHGQPDEVFWLEITDRAEVGEDLQWYVYQLDRHLGIESTTRTQSFVMVDEECAVGDLVFHLDLLEGAIIGCSKIAGPWKPEMFEGMNYWRVPLADYEDLPEPLELARLSARKAAIQKGAT